jgi:8-amino-7-oxononanoate synthase
MTRFDYISHFKNTLEKLENEGRVRQALVRPKNLISFATNDYLGLSRDQEIIDKTAKVLISEGVSTGGSKYICGQTAYHQMLENSLAAYKNRNKCLIYGTGYLACFGVISALAGREDLIVADKFIHASLIDGCINSAAKLARFEHNNTEALEVILQKHRHLYKKCVIVTETVFSMHGTVAPLDEILTLGKRYNCLVVTDDAHGFGVIKQEYQKYDLHVEIGTLSKAIAAFGGYVCADELVITYLANFSRTQIYSTSLPAHIAFAAYLSIEKIAKYGDKMREDLDARCAVFNSKTPIINIPLPSNQTALSVRDKMLENGYFIQAIRPPTTPNPCLRINLNLLHQLDMLHKFRETLTTHF